ncbi:transposase family protein [Burkholderia thailandensis]|uniref:Transposase family protein n=1 Tax=Burkholderia thailandensis TaxID=57975 RepID=A0AAW9CTH5_BURTH|nr:transposase family protein [Burkholderia thailandensis]
MDSIEILSEPERRRRRTAQEKIAIVQETLEPGASVSAVARRHGVNANQVFGWRKQYQEGSLAAVKAGETVVPASELAAAVIPRFARGSEVETKRPWPAAVLA